MARNIPTYSVQMSMTDPFDTPDWIDITRFVRSGTTKRGRQHELQRAQAGTCALTITNQDPAGSRRSTQNSPYINLMTAADSYFLDVPNTTSTPGSWVPGTNCKTLIAFNGVGFDGYPALDIAATANGTVQASTGTGANGYAVTAGNVYGFQAQFVDTGTARSCSVGVAWYNSSHTQIGSTTFGTAVTDTTPAYTKATLTATAPAGAVTAALVIQIASMVANEFHFVTRAMISHADTFGQVSTAWAPGGRGLVPARPIQVLATFSSTQYPVYYGFVDSWLPSYGVTLSNQVINCTDGLNLLALAYMTNSAYFQQCVTDGSANFWYFGDPPAATSISDSVGFIDITFASGVLPGFSFGNPGILASDVHTSATFVGNSGGAINTSQSVSIASGYTVECVMESNTLAGMEPSSGILLPLLLKAGTPQGGISALQTGNVQFSQPGGFGLFGTPTAVNDGKPHHLAFTWASGGAYKGYVDGVQVGSGSTSAPSGSATFEIGGIEGSASVSVAGMSFTPTALTGAQIAVHAGLALDGFIQQQSGQRITAVLGTLGVPASLQSIATGISAVQAPQSSLTTSPSLSYIQTVENTEQGFFYVDEAGIYTYRDRHYVLQNAAAITSNATFASDTNTSHHKIVAGSIVPAEDALDLWNDAPVSATANLPTRGGRGHSEGRPELQTAQARLPLSRTLQGYTSMLQTSDVEALALSQWLVAHYATPIPRVRQMKLNSNTTTPSTLPQMLGRKLLDRITVIWQPLDGSASAFTQDSLIETIQHDFGPDLWTTTWGLSVAETQTYFTLNDATFGTLAATGSSVGNRLGF